MPATCVHLSDNGQYCLVVVPGGEKLDRSLLPDSLTFDHIVAIPPHDTAMGTLYRKNYNGVYEDVWTTSMVNYVAPVEVLVDDLGKWVVTINPLTFWMRGNNVVAIHDAQGEIVRVLNLADMLPREKINGLWWIRNSTRWFCSATIFEEEEQLELRVADNYVLMGLTRDGDCGDSVRIDLTTGNVISYHSQLEEVMVAYPDSCFEDFHCPGVRLFYYRVNNPGPSISARVDSLHLEGNSIDSLRRIYECFSNDALWNLGAALQCVGRKTLLVYEGIASYNFALLVETNEDLLVGETRDSFPVIVRLPDSTLAFPLAAHEPTFAEAILRGGEEMFTVGYTMKISEQEGIGPYFPLTYGGLSTIYTADSAINIQTNVYLQGIDFGTRVFIDLTKTLVREKTP